MRMILQLFCLLAALATSVWAQGLLDSGQHSNPLISSVTAQAFNGTSLPGAVAGNLSGDTYLYIPISGTPALYFCAAAAGTASPACTSVSTGQWQTAGSNSTTINITGSSASAIASQLPKFRLALATTRDGGADTRILFVGDSTTEGIGTANVSNDSYVNRIKMSGSSTPPIALGLAIYNTQDARWTLGTGWAVVGSYYGFCNGGNNAGVFNESGASGNLTFTPGATQGTYDSFTVYYLSYPGNGSVTATATGGAPATISTNSTAGYGKTTVTAASAGTGNSVVIAPVSGSVYILGIEPFLSTTPSIRKANVGVSGATSAECSSSAGPFTSIQAIEYYAPNLTLISLGINDAYASVASSAYIANIQAVITAAQQSGDVILQTLWPTNPSVGLTTLEQQYVAAVNALAVNDGIPVFDVWQRMGNAFDAALTNGDGVHPNSYGYWDWASGLDGFINQFAWK